MTTVYQRNPQPGPGIHVLAIGVGNYPHLIGGSGALTNNPLGLAQLSSPAVSANAFIDWCIAPLLNANAIGLRNADCSLASVEALVSGDAPITINTTEGTLALDNASLENIQLAFDAWLARVAAGDGNIGVFYFCGHGIMVADQYLLADDFGRNNGRPWDRAFDVSNTLRAVEREVKGALFFFIDACREISRDVAQTLAGTPGALQVVDLKKPVVRTSTALIQATGEGKLAFAVEGRVSRFTEALLSALSGYCGVRRPGAATWDVDGESLASAVRRLLENGNKTAKRRQVTDQIIGGSPVPLLRLVVAPRVKVELDLLPEQRRAASNLFLRSAKGAQFEHQGRLGAFLTEVPRGYYSVGAHATDPQYGDLLYEDQDLVPPLFDLTMPAPP